MELLSLRAWGRSVQRLVRAVLVCAGWNNAGVDELLAGDAEEVTECELALRWEGADNLRERD